MSWYPIQSRRAFAPGSRLFGFLDLFPLGPYCFWVPRLGLSKNVGMTAHKFISNVATNPIKIKGLAFSGQLAMKDDLEQEIAQFIHHLLVVPFLDGIEQFIHFLHRMDSQTTVGLLTVPRATIRRSELLHDLQKRLDGGGGFHGYYRMTRLSR